MTSAEGLSIVFGAAEEWLPLVTVILAVVIGRYLVFAIVHLVTGRD